MRVWRVYLPSYFSYESHFDAVDLGVYSSAAAAEDRADFVRYYYGHQLPSDVEIELRWFDLDVAFDVDLSPWGAEITPATEAARLADREKAS